MQLFGALSWVMCSVNVQRLPPILMTKFNSILFNLFGLYNRTDPHRVRGKKLLKRLNACPKPIS